MSHPCIVRRNQNIYLANTKLIHLVQQGFFHRECDKKLCDMVRKASGGLTSLRHQSLIEMARSFSEEEVLTEGDSATLREAILEACKLEREVRETSTDLGDFKWMD